MKKYLKKYLKKYGPEIVCTLLCAIAAFSILMTFRPAKMAFDEPVLHDVKVVFAQKNKAGPARKDKAAASVKDAGDKPAPALQPLVKKPDIPVKPAPVAKRKTGEEKKNALQKINGKTKVDDNLLAGDPVTSGNVTVFPLYYAKKPESIETFCLAEAIEDNTFIIKETSSSGTVNSVKVINNSGKPVFLLSGEVIFGGKQDRIIATDTIVPPKDGEEFSVSVYCVEHGRWTKRRPPQQVSSQFSCGKKKQLGPRANASSRKPGQVILGEEVVVTKGQPRGTSFDNLSNKNLNSTSVQDAYGVGGAAAGAYGQRWGKGSLVTEGGSPGTESATFACLRWLHFHQDKPEGKWDTDGFGKNCKGTGSPCTGGATGMGDVEATSIALLTFLGHGQTHRVGKFKRTVRRGLEWLIKQQENDGSFKGKDGKEDLAVHAAATSALAEAFAITRDTVVKGPAGKAVDYLTSHQRKDSGWGRTAGAKPDTFTTGWAVIALKSARMGKLNVPSAAFTNAIKFFDSVTDRKTGYTAMSADETDKNGLPRATAIAVLSRIFCGQKRTSRAVKQGVKILMSSLPDYNKPKCDKVDYDYWFWGTYSMFQIGGPKWKTWNQATKKALLKTQRAGKICQDGSWNPDGKAKTIGRVGATAYASLTLQIYYRYARAGVSTAYQKRNTQGAVWKNVAKLNSKMGTANSTGTFRENLTTKKAAKKVEDPVSTFTKAFLGDGEIVGFACAVNGEILYLDIFPFPRMAKNFRFRLLKSYALEGVNRTKKNGETEKAIEALTAQDVSDFVKQGNEPEISKSETAHGVGYHIQAGGGVLRTDVKLNGKLVRRAYFKIER